MTSVCADSCGLSKLGERLAGAFSRSGLGARDLLVVTAGGCAGFVASWVEATRYRIPLGRSLPFALGLSVSQRDREVFVFLGDGEAAGVGGHHLLHAARRGDRVRTLVVNNEVLEGTGGFPSPTTPRGGRTAVVGTGSAPGPLDIAELARSAGAAWVGREIVTAGPLLDDLLDEFLVAPPFALLEIRAPCYPGFGQWNGYATPEAMHAALEGQAVREGDGDGPAIAGVGVAFPRFRAGRLWPPRGES